MPFEELKAAVLAADGDAVVRELSEWSEADRKRAVAPLNELIEQLDSPKNFARHFEASSTKRKSATSAAQPIASWQAIRTSYVLDIARLGVVGYKEIRGSGLNILGRDQERMIQVLADRRPVWLDKWLKQGLTKNMGGISLGAWFDLFRAGLTKWDDDNEMLAVHIASDLPELRINDRDTADEMLQQIPEVRELIYRVPQLDMYWIYQRWAPLVEEAVAAGTLDRPRFIRSVLSGLQMGFKRDHHQDCIGLAEMVGASAEEWSAVQSELAGLLNHSLSAVVGFALEILDGLDQVGQLDRTSALPALASVFNLKPKNHAKHVLGMLERMVDDPAIRPLVVTNAAAGLMHPHVDIQKAVLKFLGAHLRADDFETVDQLKHTEPTIAASLRPKLNDLLTQLDETPAPADVQEVDVAPSADLDFYEQQLPQIDKTIRQLLSLDEAVEAARHLRIDVPYNWPLMSGRVLGGVEAITPIASVDELIDTISAAVAKLEKPEECDRIVDGLARFAGEKPDNFSQRTAALNRRVLKNWSPWSRRGLLGGQYGEELRAVLSAWLMGAPAKEDADEEGPEEDLEEEFDLENNEDLAKVFGMLGEKFLSSGILDVLKMKATGPDCIAHIIQRVRLGLLSEQPFQLLCTPTHQGGWIDPAIWVSRLGDALKSGQQIDVADFAKSVLRLAPDGRRALISQVEDLEQPFRDLAVFVLGGEVDLTGVSGDARMWVAACRARDVAMVIPPSAAFAEDLQGPDVLQPAEYSCRLTEGGTVPFSGGKIPIAVEAALTADAQADVEFKMGRVTFMMDYSQGHPSAEMHVMPVLNNAGWFFPWMAAHWPAKLDWYWLRAISNLGMRVEDRASIDQMFGQFLLPLFERDRPLTKMAARVLWVATISKDTNARTVALDVWVELIAEARADIMILCGALWDVAQPPGFKNNRLAAAMSEVATVSPAHAWTAAEIVQRYLAVHDPLPRDAHTLLEPLQEWLTGLGLQVAEPLRPLLEQLKSGKAKALAKQLLARVETPSLDRQAALQALLTARFERAQRFSDP